MTITTIGFAGLGLIGGSIAKALRRVRSDLNIIAFDPDRDSLTAALADGTLNQAHDTLSQGFSQCDIIFLCAPVKINIQNLQLLAQVANPRCIFTDVGSVKSPIDQAVHTMGLSSRFIGGHPMAGVENFGYQAAIADLFVNASMILTDEKNTDHQMLKKAKELFLSIGFSHICHCSPAEHDRMIAYTSQLAHIVSSAYVQSPAAERHLGFSAGSFQDMTRVAKLNEAMWIELFLANRNNLLEELNGLIIRLEQFSAAIYKEDKDELFTLLHQGRLLREKITDHELKSGEKIDV